MDMFRCVRVGRLRSVLHGGSRTCRNLCNWVHKSKGRRPSAAKRLVAQRDELACNRAGAAVIVRFKQVLHFPLAAAPLSRAVALTAEAANG